MNPAALSALAGLDRPLHDPAGRTFWDAIDDGLLVLPRCGACGRWQWYPTETGPCCADAELQWSPVAGTGTVFSYTIVRYPFLAELAAALPVAVGLLELDGTVGLRFVAVLDTDRPAIGMRVRMRVADLAGRRLPVFEASP